MFVYVKSCFVVYLFVCLFVCSLTHACFGYSQMEEVHLVVLKTLASQASVMMDVACAMGTLLPAYLTSYKTIQSVFLSFIEQAGRYTIRFLCNNHIG